MKYKLIGRTGWEGIGGERKGIKRETEKCC